MGHATDPADPYLLASLLCTGADRLPDVTRHRFATGTDVHRALVLAVEELHGDALTGIARHRAVDACGYAMLDRLVLTDRVRQVSVEPTFAHLGQWTRGRALSEVHDLM